VIRRRIRSLLLLAAAAAVGLWLYRDRPSLPGLVDRVTGPLFGSRAAVKESEHKRVESEALPAIEKSQDANIAALREGMTRNEVRDILGPPDSSEEIRLENGKVILRWTYNRAGRVIDFDDARVVAIAVK
jgi:hypothetical protein